mmetsp:Transcript_8026/g.17960  ORF Transcript_8026/g.17960 Transcript_8026/m.17960 type:complete len:328 (+) Transcript_8026:1-984(+)
MVQHNIMDYSLIVGIHEAADVLPNEQTIEKVRHGPPVLPEIAPTAVFRKICGGCQGFSKDNGCPAIYYMGIIDILQQWVLKKKIAHCFKKSTIGFFYEIDTEPPGYYQSRFISAMTEHVQAETKAAAETRYRQSVALKAADLQLLQERMVTEAIAEGSSEDSSDSSEKEDKGALAELSRSDEPEVGTETALQAAPADEHAMAVAIQKRFRGHQARKEADILRKSFDDDPQTAKLANGHTSPRLPKLVAPKGISARHSYEENSGETKVPDSDGGFIVAPAGPRRGAAPSWMGGMCCSWGCDVPHDIVDQGSVSPRAPVARYRRADEQG